MTTAELRAATAEHASNLLLLLDVLRDAFDALFAERDSLISQLQTANESAELGWLSANVLNDECSRLRVIAREHGAEV